MLKITPPPNDGEHARRYELASFGDISGAQQLACCFSAVVHFLVPPFGVSQNSSTFSPKEVVFFFSSKNGLFFFPLPMPWHGCVAPPSQNAKCHASFAKYAAKSVYLIRCLGAGGSQLGFKTRPMTDWLAHHDILAIATQKIFGLYNWVVQSRPIL